MSNSENPDNELFTVDEVGDLGNSQTEVTNNTDPKLTTTKKTKKQKAEEIRSHKTLFVRNVPQQAQDSEFSDFFQKFGPLKTCFLVRNPTDKKCKGFGFVNFSMKEDADKAIEECKKTEFLGKLLKLEWAIKKSIDDKTSAKEKEGIPLKKKSNNRGQQKSDLNELDRTVAITNLSNSTGRPQLVKFLEEHGHSAIDLQYKGGRGLAIGTFETVEIAQIVVSSLQNQTLQKNKLEIQFLAQLISKTKSNRLILRNLPFQLSEPELIKLGNGIGAVVEAKIARHSDTNKPLGFGFLQFLTNEQSELAIKELNNKEIYSRKININWCSGKDYQVKEEEGEKFDIKEEINEDELENYGQNAKMFEDNQSDEMLTSDESSSEGEDDDEDQEEKDDEDKENGGDEDNEAEESENDMEVDEDEEELTKAEEPNTTLFIRNILFETTEQDLFEHFTEFGPIKYARIVMDQTGRSRGTGFVKFYKTKDAKKVLDEAAAAKATLPGTAPTTKSVLKLELPQSQTSRLMLQDRLLDVVLAVDKEEATKLATPNKKKDKKNLYLLKEGVVFPKTPEAEGLPEVEITKRLQSHDLRKRQLEKNPSLFVSKTRLAIRNMPLDWTDKELRTLAREAVPNFKREAKEGKREDLTKQEKAEGWDQKPKLKQVKVEVDKKQVSATTNKPKSKGFGFIEFEQHSHALAALRYLNCNPNVKGLDKGAKEAKKSQESKGRINRRLLLVEFSVENKLVLKKRDDRKRKLESIQKTNANNKSTKNDAKNENNTPFKKQKRTKTQADNNDKPKKRKFFHKGKQ